MSRKRVRVVAEGSAFRGREGEILRRSEDPFFGPALSVRLEGAAAPRMTFYENEVEVLGGAPAATAGEAPR